MPDTDNLREAAKTIRGTLYSILIYSAFCVTAMGFEPSPEILKSGEITVPILQAKIRYITFFYIAPLILLVMAAYLHLFVGYFKTGIKAHEDVMVLPAIFTLDNIPARALSEAFFYILTPAVIFRFYWVMDDLAPGYAGEPEAIEQVECYLLNLSMVSAGVFFYLANKREDFLPEVTETNPYKIVLGAVVVLLVINVFAFGFIREELKSKGEILISFYDESPIPELVQSLFADAGPWVTASHRTPTSALPDIPEPSPPVTVEKTVPDESETSAPVTVEGKETKKESKEETPKKIEGYAFYGIYYDGEWSERYFSNTNARRKLLPPETGDCVKATGSVSIRAGYIEQDPKKGWTNQKWVGTIKPGEEFTVLEVKQVVTGFYWMGFSKGCGG